MVARWGAIVPGVGGGAVLAALLFALAPIASAASVAVVPAASHRALWTNLTASVGSPPPSLSGAGMAWDTAAGYGVLFGGEPNLCCGPAYSNATWTFNGSWHNVTAKVGTPPAGRDVHAQMAYDAGTGSVVLFGGDVNGQGLSDTWNFTGGKWSNLTGSLSTSPPARTLGSLAYDYGTGALILFGGSSTLNFGGGFFNDTWEFVHGSWTQLHPKHAPSPRRGAQMAWDPSVHALVLVGGVNSAGTGLIDTWYFTGTTWKQMGFVSPGPEWLGSISYVPKLNAVALYGGCTAAGCVSANGTTYLFEGAKGWYVAGTLHHLATTPGVREGQASALDGTSGQFLIVGGDVFSAPNYGASNQTWALT
jgi:hypothetical protein